MAPEPGEPPAPPAPPAGTVTAVSARADHYVSKHELECIRLLAGLGVEGDAHLGKTVKHRSRAAKTPELPNLRQVHLIHSELHDELTQAGFDLQPGQMGENVTTRGVALLSLPTGTRLSLGGSAVVELTGLRNPCSQLDELRPGLMKAVLGRGEDGRLIRKTGVMGIVLDAGEVRPGDTVTVRLPPEPHRALEPV